MSFRSLAFLLYFFGSSAAALTYPMAGLVCYVVLYHVYPQTAWWGGSLESLGIRYSLICGSCLLIGTIINAGRTKFSRCFPLLHPIEIGVLAVYAAMLLTLVTGTTTDDVTFTLIDKMGKVVIFVLVMSRLLVSRQHLWTFTLILTVMALYLGLEAKTAPSGSFVNNRLNGIGGPDFRESSGLAIHLSALLPFVAVVFWQKRLSLRLLAFFASAYSINAIVLCRARAAFLASIVAALIALIYVPKRFRRWIAGVLLVAVIGGFSLSDPWFWKRMDTIVVTKAQERDHSAAARLDIWSSAWNMLANNPMGVGVGQFRKNIVHYSNGLLNAERDAHNSFMQCVCETGIGGLIAYVMTIALAWIALNRLTRRVRSQLAEPDFYEWLILANRLSIVVFVVTGLFVSRFYTEGMWWMLVLPVSLTRAVENEIRETSQEELVLLVQTPSYAESFSPGLAIAKGIA